MMNRTIWINEQNARSNRVDGTINVHWGIIIEGHYMNSILIPQVSSQPFNALPVSYLWKHMHQMIFIAKPYIREILTI